MHPGIVAAETPPLAPLLNPQVGVHPPGEALLQAIHEGRRDGRPTFLHHGVLAVPRPQQFAFVPLNLKEPRDVLPMTAADGLTSADAARQALWKRDSLAALRRLYGAVLRDVGGEPHSDVATYLERDDRKAYGELSKARGQWARLGAWPWVCFDEGKLGEDWWEHELVVDTWAGWIDPRAWRAAHTFIYSRPRG